MHVLEYVLSLQLAPPCPVSDPADLPCLVIRPAAGPGAPALAAMAADLSSWEEG